MQKAAFAACLIAAALVTGCKAKPEMTIQQFMAKKVDPTSKVYFDAVSSSSELVDGKVVETNKQPQTDAEWEKVRQAAADLQAQGKTLGEDYADGRREDWKKMSSDLVTMGQRAEAAAKSHNPDAVFEAAGNIYLVCDGCHTAYPKDSKTAGGGSAS